VLYPLSYWALWLSNAVFLVLSDRKGGVDYIRPWNRIVSGRPAFVNSSLNCRTILRGRIGVPTSDGNSRLHLAAPGSAGILWGLFAAGQRSAVHGDSALQLNHALFPLLKLNLLGVVKIAALLRRL
jgi:hypothetical protein